MPRGTATLDSHSYTHDAVGNPLTDNNNGFNASFGYDDLYRITDATDPTGSYAWGYDADNNRLSQLLNGSTTSYTVDTANHLTSVGGVPVFVGANDNLTDDGQGNTFASKQEAGTHFARNTAGSNSAVDVAHP